MDIIISCLSEEKGLSVIRNQCEHIEKLLKISRENFGEILEYQHTLRAAIAKVWSIIETKQTAAKLIAEGHQKIDFGFSFGFIRTNHRDRTSQALANGIKILGDVIGWVLELILKTLPTEEFSGYCQNIKRSRQAVEGIQSKDRSVNERKKEVLSKLSTIEVKYQKAIDEFQLSKQKGKRESEDESETSQKRQPKSSTDSEMSQKRKCESEDDSEGLEKRQRLAESSHHWE